MSCGGNPNRGTLKTVTCADDFDLLGVQNGEWVQVPKSCIDSLGASVCVVDTDLIPANIKAGISITSCGTTVVGTYTGASCTIGGTAVASDIITGKTVTLNGSNVLVGTYVPGTCNLVANPAQILSGATVSAGGSTVTGTYTCPACPACVIPSNLTPAVIREGEVISICGTNITGTHQTTISNLLQDMGMSDPTVFGFAGGWSTHSASSNGESLTTAPRVAKSGDYIAFIGIMKSRTGLMFSIKRFNTNTKVWNTVIQPIAYAFYTSNGYAFELTQNGSVVSIGLANVTGNPDTVWNEYTYDIDTNTVNMTSSGLTPINFSDLGDSTSASDFTVDNATFLSIANASNTIVVPGFPGSSPYTGSLVGNSVVGNDGNTYFTKHASRSLNNTGVAPVGGVSLIFACVTP